VSINYRFSRLLSSVAISLYLRNETIYWSQLKIKNGRERQYEAFETAHLKWTNSNVAISYHGRRQEACPPGFLYMVRI